MRKSTKLAILVAALVALCSIAALAADTWKQEGDQWFCYDKDGNPYYGAWKKSGSNWYYLDDATGAMATNKLVETDGFKYWCGEDGARVTQKWVQVPNENNTDDGFEWMFFQALTGKAVVGDGATNPVTFKSIKNAEGVTRKYLFDTDGYMLSGYLTDALGKADDVVAATYYMGPKDEGWQRTEWQKFVDGELSAYDDQSLVYFYFKNSKKVTSADHEDGQYKVSTGKYYQFKADGKLLTGWQGAGTGAYYLGADNDGLKHKKEWQKTDKVDGTEGWTYLGSDGAPYAAAADTDAQIKKVNGKYYLFNEKGRMLSGVAVIYTKDDTDPLYDGQYCVALPSEFEKIDDFKNYELEYADYQRFYYFSTDDADGSMKTGVQTITIEGEEATVNFDKHGVAYEGLVNNKIYNNGILQSAGDSKYVVATLKTRGAGEKNFYLVNAAGTIIKKAKVTDADGYWFAVKEDYSIYKFAAKDYAAQAATAFMNGKYGFKIGSQWYVLGKDDILTEKGKVGTLYKWTGINYKKCDAEPTAFDPAL